MNFFEAEGKVTRCEWGETFFFDSTELKTRFNEMEPNENRSWESM